MSESGLRLYHFEPRVGSLGPGLRCGLWVQGCSLGCPGCLVPDSHDPEGGKSVPVSELVETIVALDDIEGITVSGGEPFEQALALSGLLSALRRARPDLSVMLYSGYTRRAIERKALHRQILTLADILVSGPFIERQAQPDAWRGSANQEIHFLTDRHAREEVPLADGELEFVFRPGGGFFMVGIPPRKLWRRLTRRLRQRCSETPKGLVISKEGAP